MATYWTAFVSGLIGDAADFAGDMLPVLALLAGIALAERVIRFFLSISRG